MENDVREAAQASVENTPIAQTVTESNSVTSSLWDNIRTKLTNPFFGTLIIVWLIHNWHFVFTLFNFEEGLTRKHKIALLKSHFGTWNGFYWNLAECILTTFIVLAASYLLMYLAKWLSEFYDTKSRTLMQRVSPKKVPLLSEYQQLQKDYDNLDRRYVQEKTQRAYAQQEADKLKVDLKAKENELQQEKKNFLNQNNAINSEREARTELQQEVKQLKQLIEGHNQTIADHTNRADMLTVENIKLEKQIETLLNRIKLSDEFQLYPHPLKSFSLNQLPAVFDYAVNIPLEKVDTIKQIIQDISATSSNGIIFRTKANKEKTNFFTLRLYSTTQLQLTTIVDKLKLGNVNFQDGKVYPVT